MHYVEAMLFCWTYTVLQITGTFPQEKTNLLLKTNRILKDSFWKLDLLQFSVERGKKVNLLGPLERANLNYWKKKKNLHITKAIASGKQDESKRCNRK
jgi:hypothetical protein